MHTMYRCTDVNMSNGLLWVMSHCDYPCHLTYDDKHIHGHPTFVRIFDLIDGEHMGRRVFLEDFDQYEL